MKIIIPMAGIGKRMRPHTLTMPKPLIPVAGKPMVQRIVEDMKRICHEQFTDVGFVISPSFGQETEKELLALAEQLNAKGHIFYQHQPLGTAHAILCAEKILKGKILIAFSDTLFIPAQNVKVNTEEEGIIWVEKVKDPHSFGVVKLNKDGYITDFVEKPRSFISDLAIIGIYYFKNGTALKKEMQHLIDKNIKEKGEYQLTNAMENMKNKGTKFVTSQVSEWLDCGNKDAVLYTNKRILETYHQNGNTTTSNIKHQTSNIIQPCFIGKNVQLINSTIGPNVSIGDNTVVENSIIKNSIVQTNTQIRNAELSNSMLGNYVEFSARSNNASIGDYSVVKN